MHIFVNIQKQKLTYYPLEPLSKSFDEKIIKKEKKNTSKLKKYIEKEIPPLMPADSTLDEKALHELLKAVKNYLKKHMQSIGSYKLDSYFSTNQKVNLEGRIAVGCKGNA